MGNGRSLSFHVTHSVITLTARGKKIHLSLRDYSRGREIEVDDVVVIVVRGGVDSSVVKGKL